MRVRMSRRPWQFLINPCGTLGGRPYMHRFAAACCPAFLYLTDTAVGVILLDIVRGAPPIVEHDGRREHSTARALSAGDEPG